MAWLRVREVSFSYGGANILEGIDLQIQPGDRIGLMGRNGAGKSTLMRLIEGTLQPDHGEVERSPQLRIARMAQEVPGGRGQTVYDEVAAGLGETGRQLARIHSLTQRGPELSPSEHAELEQLQRQLDTETSWKWQQQIDTVIERMGLQREAGFDALSSGMKRRVLLAQALVSQPEVLLLDEPTNHLDVDSIQWLEEFLLRESLTLIFITHDRVFLQKLANRIVEVERGRLFDWTCDYPTFLARKEAALEAEAQQQALFDKRLAEEEVWIRKGIKARNVRNQGRVRELEKMRAERKARRTQVGNVSLQAQAAERTGNLVIHAQNLYHDFHGKQILEDFSTTVSRGDKIGILGPNGAGKTTLLRILLGQLTPNQGTIRLGTNLQVAYFDQLRAQLAEDQSAVENVSEGSDTVMINGRSKHVLGYLQDFLFTGERARSLVRYLSGGERNRLLLAKMFTKPSNVLVLDEPTNDLDAETLELLEELLAEYPGTVLLVSHDRAFLNNLVTSTLVFEGDGRVKEYAGGYDDWVRQKTEAQRETQSREAVSTAVRIDAERNKTERARRLSFKEQRELEALPGLIEKLETEQSELEATLANPGFYQQAPTEIARVTNRLTEVHAELQTAYQRWDELESVAS